MKRGTVREDGYRYWGTWRGYQKWYSPQAFARKVAKSNAYNRLRNLNLKGAALEKHRANTRSWAKQWRLKNREKVLVVAARTRAKHAGVPCTITFRDIVIPKRCPVLGVCLQTNVGACQDNSPSLDRVIPALGYVPGNVIVISRRANRIKNDATAEELMRVASFYLKRSASKRGPKRVV